jgi:nitrile hydratase
MDGIHDLGGRHGFGKIDVGDLSVDAEEVQYTAPYECRVRSMVNAVTPAPDWNIDWFRHCRELIDPVDYLTRPYFDQWVQTYSAMLVNSGWATVDEVVSGKSASGSIDGVRPPTTAEQARAAVLKARCFDAEVSEKPMFADGDTVLTITTVPTTHTRLPAYARGRRGTVISHHGAHVFPDAMALNEKRHVHLYTVEFGFDELWPESNGSNDTVTLDLWETYLERV